MPADLPRLTASPSIYEFLAARIDEDGRLPEGLTLPDEAPTSPDTIGWAAGAFDGIFGHHSSGGGGDSDARARQLAALVAKAAAGPSRRRLSKLLAACSNDMLYVVDPMIDRLVELRAPRDGVRRVARWLATTATERGPVKLGIALLGVTGIGDVGLLHTLGAHDEFTLYAVVAFGNATEDGGEGEMWRLAKVVDGWGRIHCVERLSRSSDPAIRRWILRTGFRNSIAYEYLAFIAATAGGLLEALRDDDVDRELLDAAGDIIAALIAGGPAENLDDWAEGAVAIETYLSVLTTRAETLRDYLGVAAVRDFLAGVDGWDERSARGWTATHRTALEGTCADILGRPAWIELATKALASPDRATRWLADQVLRDRGASTFEHHFAAISADPRESGWFEAWEQADGVGAQRLVHLARDVLPLNDLASGAGPGPRRADRLALEATLQALVDHPGVGGDLLIVGLKNPVIRNRNAALRALELWPRNTWPDGARALVAAVADGDPDDTVRARAERLL